MEACWSKIIYVADFGCFYLTHSKYPDNALSVFFYMADMCPIEQELVRNHSLGDEKTYFQADSQEKAYLKQDQLHFYVEL